MTEITVTVPLSFFGAAGITPEGIQQLADAQQQKAQIETQNLALRNALGEFAGTLQRTLDADMDIMHKFSSLRQLASETGRFAQT